jgi:hypothetical protein
MVVGLMMPPSISRSFNNCKKPTNALSKNKPTTPQKPNHDSKPNVLFSKGRMSCTLTPLKTFVWTVPVHEGLFDALQLAVVLVLVGHEAPDRLDDLQGLGPAHMAVSVNPIVRNEHACLVSHTLLDTLEDLFKLHEVVQWMIGHDTSNLVARSPAIDVDAGGNDNAAASARSRRCGDTSRHVSVKSFTPSSRSRFATAISTEQSPAPTLNNAELRDSAIAVLKWTA